MRFFSENGRDIAIVGQMIEKQKLETKDIKYQWKHGLHWIMAIKGRGAGWNDG